MTGSERRPASFDLEHAISGWRRRLSARRTFSPDDLDELESHLRDRIDVLTAEGLDTRAAFFDATNRVGEPETIETEYRKMRWDKARHNKNMWRQWTDELGMIASYMALAFRNLRRNPGYALINIGGLAVGIAVCIVITLFVLYETGFDRHHEHADRIFRVTREWFNENDESVMHLARISIPIAPAIESEFPEVERSVRLWQISAPVSRGEALFMEQNLYLVDSTYFDVFSHNVLAGDLRTALTRPNTAVITRAVASRYFGEADPIGKTLTLFGSTEVEITGLAESSPPRSHAHPEILVSFATGEAWLNETQRAAWGMFNNFATYVLLTPTASAAELETKLPAFLRAHYQPENNSRDELRLQPLTDIHLHSSLDAELEPNGNITYVFLFGVVAAFVLLIACFNFVNLATARSMYRAREVGVRKVLGAGPAQIVRQFLGEAVLLATLATLLAVGIAGVSIPYLTDFTGRRILLAADSPWMAIGSLAVIVLIVGVAAGGYPALILSRFQPERVLKSRTHGSWRSRLRSGLVIAQFTIALVLISGVMVVLRQVDYVQNSQLGFEKEHLVVLPANTQIRNDFRAVKDRLLESPHIRAVTASNLVPSSALVDHIGVEADVAGSMVRASLPLNPIDHDFVETYGLQIVAGRDFSAELASDSTEAFILNESAVNQLGWSSPDEAIGRRFVFDGNSLQRAGTVVGVVNDFHFESLRERISPLVLFVMPDRLRNVTVRIAGADIEREIAFLETLWSIYQTGQPFSFSFIDQNFGALYQAEQQVGAVFGLFAGLAVVIACLGLFGLASFVTERRRKEIGIRKALGASVASVVASLTGRFLSLVGVAFVLALPAAYILSSSWLSGFAYHVAFNPLHYVAAGVGLFLIAFGSVGFESVRSAMMSPVVSLRDE